MTPAGQAARDALAAHDLGHGEDRVFERVAEAALFSTEHAEALVAYVLDREGLAVEQAPETQAAARDVVAAVREVAR